MSILTANVQNLYVIYCQNRIIHYIILYNTDLYKTTYLIYQILTVYYYHIYQILPEMFIFVCEFIAIL